MAYRDELDAALQRAEAAERRLASNCYVHPNAPIAVACMKCQRGICEACTMPALDGAFCSSCFARTAASVQRRQMSILVGVAAGAVGVAALLMLWPRQAPLSVSEPNPPKDTHAWRTQAVRDRLAKEPCNRSAALELAENYDEDGEYLKTIAFVDDFSQRCGTWPRLLWTKVAAHEERSEWRKAVDVDTVLIENEPTDGDFWWWRGKALLQLSRIDEAAADFRQMTILSSSSDAFAWFVKAQEQRGRPCDAAFALRRWSTTLSEDESDWATRRSAQLYLSGCQLFEGEGTVTVHKTKAGFARTEVQAGAAKGQFVVDEETGLTTLTRAFAARAGIAVKDTVVSVVVAGRLRRGQLAFVDLQVGDASAPAVEVMVTDEIAPAIDGVLGASFLQRFALVETPTSLTLAPSQ